MKVKKVIIFARKNYLLTVFFFIILFVGFVAFSRIFVSKPIYVYAKVKVGQGLWWANTGRPSIWYVGAINKRDVARGITGKPSAEVLGKRYYRYYGSDQFDMYLTMRLKVGGNAKTGMYTFNRSALSVGSPVEIQFPKSNITGTVTALSQKPFEEKLVEKTLTLTKRNAFPWELDAIRVGDSYYDGEDTIFTVIDKSAINTASLSFDPYWNSGAGITEQTRYITVKAKVKLREVSGQWILGEDQLVVPGKNLSISTPNFVFDNYIVSKID